jgi:hypothetical protein
MVPLVTPRARAARATSVRTALSLRASRRIAAAYATGSLGATSKPARSGAAAPQQLMSHHRLSDGHAPRDFRRRADGLSCLACAGDPR